MPFTTSFKPSNPIARVLAHLVEIDDGLPELILQLVEVPHAHLSKVSRMVLVEIRSVMMLTTSHTTSTRMLSVLANTSVTSGDVAAAASEQC